MSTQNPGEAMPEGEWMATPDGGGLKDSQKRAVATLLSRLDVALERHLLRLEDPFKLDADQRSIWSSKLRLLGEALQKCVGAADETLVDPDSIVGELRDVDEALRVHCEVAAAEDLTSESLQQEYREFHGWLVDYLSYAGRAVRHWLVFEPERFK
jgi:hypothetical protein